MSSALSNFGRSTIRTVKGYTKGYSDVQLKVREATSNDPWGPSGTLMNEIATLTFNQQDFVEIMEMLDKRLNDKGKNWRHVFKALTVLDYILHSGSQNVVLYFKENLYIIKTLKEFQYIDDNGKDQGANVRQKAKDITNLLMNDEQLMTERKTRSTMRDRMSGNPSGRSGDDYDAGPRRERRQPTREDKDLERAIALSKRQAEADAAKTKGTNQGDADLEEAIRLSKEEDERRKREMANNSNSLFDDAFSNPNASSSNQNNSLIDLETPAQPTGLPLQYANPYAQLQQQQAEMWAMQQQQEQLFLMRQQEEERMRQMQMQEQQNQDAQAAYFRQLYAQISAQREAEEAQRAAMAQQQMQPLVPQKTAIGSNNPFARFASPPPQSTSSPPPMPQFSPAQSPQPASQAPVRQDSNPFPSSATSSKKPVDPKHAELEKLLAQGGGADTFGNFGATVFPQGAMFHESNRIAAVQASKTGSTNPFTSSSSPSPFQPQSQFGASLQNNGSNGFGDSFGGGGGGSVYGSQHQQGHQGGGGNSNNDTPFFTI